MKDTVKAEVQVIVKKTKETSRSIITAAYGAQGSGGAPGEGPLIMGN